MKERSILMTAPMVLATLNGQKTQTRRLVKPAVSCPYGKKGDLLYVRETWKYCDWTEDGIPFIEYAADGTKLLRDYPEDLADDVQDVWAALSANDNYKIDGRAADRKWRPAIHMPKWAARIWLEITDVRMERVNDISEADSVREGVAQIAHEHPDMSPRELFQLLFSSIYPNAWVLNHLVWAIGFRRIDRTVGAAA